MCKCERKRNVREQQFCFESESKSIPKNINFCVGKLYIIWSIFKILKCGSSLPDMSKNNLNIISFRCTGVRKTVGATNFSFHDYIQSLIVTLSCLKLSAAT